MKKIIPIGVFLLLCFSIMNSGILNINAEDPIPPSLSLVAQYMPSIVIDGLNPEWNTSNIGYFDMMEFEYEDPPPSSLDSTFAGNILQVSINFGYNDSFLFVYAYIPDSYGDVNALDLHFFGKPGTNDGIHLNDYNSNYMDLAFPDEMDPNPPTVDEDLGGVNDVYGHSFRVTTDGTYFECAKRIRSGDILGKDIHLNYGDAIAIELAAWVGVTPDGSGPNYGSMSPTGFSYIRLDIGENIGDILEIYPPYGKFFMDWIVGDQYEAPYIAQSVDIDGVANDSAWDSATLYSLKFQHMNFTSGEWYPDDVIEGKIMIFHNGADFYIFVEIDDSTEDMEDMFVIVIGDNDNMFEYPEGTDLVTISTEFYEDMILPGNQDDPIPDELFGGFTNGYGAVSYEDGKRRVEFTKPLQPGDPDGRDYDFYTGDKMFISLLIGENSFDGPNYINMDDSDTTGQPAIIVHPVKLLGEGEEPTGGEEDTNTFALAFDFSDVLVIAAAISPIIAFVYLRRRKSN